MIDCKVQKSFWVEYAGHQAVLELQRSSPNDLVYCVLYYFAVDSNKVQDILELEIKSISIVENLGCRITAMLIFF
jgi:hypothetical protein